MSRKLVTIAFIALLAVPVQAMAQGTRCDFSDVPGALWWGTKPRMTVQELASYMAPVYWFSPDEPLLGRSEGASIRIPESLPFEPAPDRPVVYYQLEQIAHHPGTVGFYRDSVDIGESIIDISEAPAFHMGFLAYFSSEEGLGAHLHDVEVAEFRGGFARATGEYLEGKTETQCEEDYYVLILRQVTGKAHGIIWFWNVLDVESDTKLPMHLLVEEGKHAVSPDRNSDGYFTPGYDVTRRVNDAWGIRDVIRSGALFHGGYKGWMTKVRSPEHRVFPPLPDDSPLRRDLARRGEYETPFVEYELRPLPATDLSLTSPGAESAKGLYKFMKGKEVSGWPEQNEARTLTDFTDFLDEGEIIRSFSVAFRADGGDLGFSFVFPLFILKNFEDPLSGGYIVHRMYIKDKELRDFGWHLMYSPSASRWVDTYFSGGLEWDKFDVFVDRENPNGSSRRVTRVDTEFVFETGIKFRANLSASPFRFLGVLTDFWGLRAGIKNKGFFDIDELTYVLEIGAGVW